MCTSKYSHAWQTSHTCNLAKWHLLHPKIAFKAHCSFARCGIDCDSVHNGVLPPSLNQYPTTHLFLYALVILRAVLPFLPNYRSGHPENVLFTLSKQYFLDQNIQKNSLFNFEKGITDYVVRYLNCRPRMSMRLSPKLRPPRLSFHIEKRRSTPLSLSSVPVWRKSTRSFTIYPSSQSIWTDPFRRNSLPWRSTYPHC